MSVPDQTYDCDSGRENWEAGWSPAKKEFCCRTTGQACHLYDCEKAFSKWDEEWSLAKRDYCCSKGVSSCSRGFDCKLGSNSSWSFQKSAWCCTHEQIGCGIKSTMTTTV